MEFCSFLACVGVPLLALIAYLRIKAPAPGRRQYGGTSSWDSHDSGSAAWPGHDGGGNPDDASGGGDDWGGGDSGGGDTSDSGGGGSSE